MIRLVTIVAASALILAACRAQIAPPVEKPAVRPESAPATRPNKAEQIALKIEKQVEKIRGITLSNPVRIGVYDKETLKDFVLKKAEKELAPEKLDPQVRALRALELLPKDFDYRKTILDLLTEQIAGFYDPDTKELRLIERSDDDLLKGVTAAMGIDTDGVVMAHELTHALQDQLVGLKNLPIEVEDDDDLVTASKSLVEGDAMVAMMGWTFSSLGLPAKKVFDPMISSMLDKTLEKSLPGAEAVTKAPEWIKQGLLFPYVEGLKFCIAIDSGDKTFAATDRALKAPPLSTEQILHPEKYGGENPDYPIAVTLPDLSGALGMPRATTNTLGELGVRVLLGEKKLPKADVLRAAAGWGGDRYALYSKAGSPDALVWLSTWDTPQDADEAESALGAWLAAANPGASSEASDVTSARYVRPDGTLDAIARKGRDVILLRGIPKEKLVPVLQKLFEETKKVERRKV